MPYYATSQEWLRQSSLLIEARPTTTRITTKYHISKPKPRRSRKSSAEQPSATTTTPATATAATAPRGSLTLKTYDPRSGACLKYRTTKAAEVARLIQSLGRPLGARMAALPAPEAADEGMVDAPPAVAGAGEGGEKDKEGAEATGSGAGAGGKAQGQGGAAGGGGGAGGGTGGGGKGKKKRGKK